MVEGQEGLTWAQWRALATLADELGFPSLYRSDHDLSEQRAYRRGGLDAWGAICGVAPLMVRVRLGTLVSPVTFRHPAVLAKLVVTADHLSGGRIDLGIGAGWYAEEHEAHVFPFPSNATRHAVLAEQLEIVRRSWATGPFSLEGKHYRVIDLDALPKPQYDATAPRGRESGAGFVVSVPGG